MHLKSRQKTFAFFLLLFALISVCLSAYRFYENIYGPFRAKSSLKTVSETNREKQTQFLNSFIALQNTDTDLDGLSDYDEIYNYKTSPYLKDTDSDGVDDGTELEQGTDPLCPKGQNCTGQETIPTNELFGQKDLEEQIPQYPKTEGVDGLEGQEVGKNAESADSAQLQDISPSEIRSLLLQSGFTKEQSDAFSDEELKGLWQETLKGGGN